MNSETRTMGSIIKQEKYRQDQGKEL